MMPIQCPNSTELACAPSTFKRQSIATTRELINEILPTFNFVTVKEDPDIVDELEKEEVTEDCNEEEDHFFSGDSEYKVSAESQWNVEECKEVPRLYAKDCITDNISNSGVMPTCVPSVDTENGVHNESATLTGKSKSVKKYECNICNKVFSRIGILNQHKLIHSGIIKNQCDVCNKIFTYSAGLAWHKVLHENTRNISVMYVIKRIYVQLI